MIQRYRYIDKIKPFIDKPLIKAITGIRRCGKSTLLKQIAALISEKKISRERIISINMELFEFNFIRTAADLHKYVSHLAKKSKGKRYLFIDEVQEIEDWEKAVNSFLAEGKYDIYISGSNAHMLSSDLATLITGRYIEFRIYTLTFSEFSELFKQKHRVKAKDIFTEYLKYGGFPGIHNLTWEETALRQYLESIYNTVLLKDVVGKNNIKDISILSHMLNFIAGNCGNITTAKSISDYSKSQHRNVSTDTVLNFLQYAMSAMLIQQVSRYDIQGKKVLETFEKYYLSDIGLQFAMIGNNPSLISGQLENVVLLELLSRGYKVTVGKTKDKEIDFIANYGSERIYIQVCTTLLDDKVQKREYGAFIGINDHYPKYVLSMDDLKFSTNSNGVRWMNIKDFLLSADLNKNFYM